MPRCSSRARRSGARTALRVFHTKRCSRRALRPGDPGRSPRSWHPAPPGPDSGPPFSAWGPGARSQGARPSQSSSPSPGSRWRWEQIGFGVQAVWNGVGAVENRDHYFTCPPGWVGRWDCEEAGGRKYTGRPRVWGTPPISRPGAGQAWGTCARADRDNVRPPSDPRASSERTAAPAARQRWGDGGCHLGPLRAAPLSTTKLPCLSSSPTSPVTGPHPLPQQHDPIINKSFLDPPLPRAPSGTLAAAAAADPFQKGGVAAARGSGRGGPSAGRGRGRAAVTGQERTLRTCAGHPLVEGGHTPGSGLGCGAERGVASPR